MSEHLTIEQHLNWRGYIPTGIDVSKEDINGVVQKYLGFLTLDERHHDATKFYLTDRGDGDFGQYTRVAGNVEERGARPDNKDIFHFGSMSRQVIESRLGFGQMPKPMREFLDDTEALFWAGQQAKHDMLMVMDAWGAKLSDVLQPETETMNDVLRLIAYYDNEDVLAKGHFDRSVTALAIGESHPGLRMTPGQNGIKVDADQRYMDRLESRLEPVEHKSGEAKFFLGAGWNRLPEDVKGKHWEDLPLAYHDVVNTGQKVDERVMRWAVVMFNNPHLGFKNYTVPTQPETRPYKQPGRLNV